MGGVVIRYPELKIFLFFSYIHMVLANPTYFTPHITNYNIGITFPRKIIPTTTY